MLRMSLGPSSQKTVTHDLMISSARLARKHPGVRLHTHLAENEEDITYTHKMYGYRFGEYIQVTEGACGCVGAHMDGGKRSGPQGSMGSERTAPASAPP